MPRVRLGAVGYLNARPLVFGLERSTIDPRVNARSADASLRFDLRFDVPSKCAELLHAHSIDVGLIPSVEYVRNPADRLRQGGGPPIRLRRGYVEPAEASRRRELEAKAEAASPRVGSQSYRIVPGVAIASRGPVASVALYTTRPMSEVRSIAMDTSSRTSVGLVQVLCARQFRISPLLEPLGPHLELMLARCDAALMIGDNALFTDPRQMTVNSQWSTTRHGELSGSPQPSTVRRQLSTVDRQLSTIEKIDLGEAWTAMTGLPFVWAFWAGRADALTADDVGALQLARDAGVKDCELIAREYFPGSPDRQRVGARYLQDNIRYDLGPDERAGLELFYRYAVEAGVVAAAVPLQFF